MQKQSFAAVLYRSAVSLAAALATVAGAIAAPILCRPFYYAQIRSLQIGQRTGLSEEVIRGAYDEVMDFLVYGAPFGTGELAYTAEGESHFVDCRKLFVLDFWVLGISVAVLLALLCVFVCKKKTGAAAQKYRHLPVFWSAAGMCAVFAVLAVWGAVDFDSLFVAFHATFFPGKSNWIFDPRYDQIINILPQQFFLHCAALIAGLIFAAVFAFFTADALWRRKQKKNAAA